MLELTGNYFIKVSSGKKARGYHYEIVSYKEYGQLKQGIGNVLDEILVQLERFNGSPAVHSKNEPPKSKKAKALAK